MVEHNAAASSPDPTVGATPPHLDTATGRPREAPAIAVLLGPRTPLRPAPLAPSRHPPAREREGGRGTVAEEVRRGRERVEEGLGRGAGLGERRRDGEGRGANGSGRSAGWERGAGMGRGGARL